MNFSIVGIDEEAVLRVIVNDFQVVVGDFLLG